MPRYLSLHALGCLPKPGFAALRRSLFEPGGRVVRRVVAGQVAERLLVEFDAPDAEAATVWLRERILTPLCVMRVDYESIDGAVRDL